jgi:tetratricopeptide (TPR) repeat protein
MPQARIAFLVLMALACMRAQTTRYELRGKLLPPTRATVWWHGATAPFEENTLAAADGQFRFRHIAAGAYTLGLFVPARGEMRRTIELGSSHADSRHRIALDVQLHDSDFESHDSLRREALVSARELSLPDKARHEYDDALQRLGRHDIEGALARLERAVTLAPGYSEAWNHLGTIAYQSRDYTRAESCFRKALAADPTAYQPLVNLGGVLLNLGQFQQGLQYNLQAALIRPTDALANSQLGIRYFYLDQLELARKYITAAVSLDPAHFSHPQLVLAQIDLRRQDGQAAAEFESFLQYHRDAPESGKVRLQLAQLRAPAADPAQEFSATGMAHSYSESPVLSPFTGDKYSVIQKDGRTYLETRDVDGKPRRKAIDAAIGSGRHLRILLSGGVELPVAWQAADAGKYVPHTSFRFSPNCMNCHALQPADHAPEFGCASCHTAATSAKPGAAVCLSCHARARGTNPTHGAITPVEDSIELNSAGYRLLASRCFQASPGKLTCITCHPAHSFSKTVAEYRAVCRSCHPTMHHGAPLECPRCHMPKRLTNDAGGILVTDHRIQRPL